MPPYQYKTLPDLARLNLLRLYFDIQFCPELLLRKKQLLSHLDAPSSPCSAETGDKKGQELNLLLLPQQADLQLLCWYVNPAGSHKT